MTTWCDLYLAGASMALCLTISVAGGGAQAVSRSGSLTPEPLAWVVGDATFANGSYGCPTGSHVLFTVQEASNMSVPGPFNLTLEEGGAIGSAVLLVWAAAFGIRMVARAMRSVDSPADFD